MPARRTRIRTSLMPMVGSGISASHNPGSRLLFTSAFMRISRPAGESRPHSYCSTKLPGTHRAIYTQENMRTKMSICFGLLLTASLGLRAQAGAAADTPSIEKKTEGMTKLNGYFSLYWDTHAGTLWLEIPRFDMDFLYVTGLAAGLGSNDIGLDRGQAGDTAVVYFQRIGPKVLLVRRNENFRSTSPNLAERLSVEDSFGKSVLQGFTVAAESNGSVLVNATDFFVRDGYGAAQALQPGKYRVDGSRSAVYLPRTKAFPKNSEIEVTLTFAREGDGGFDPGFPVQGPTAIGQGGGRRSEERRV